ncbi:MAG TPA: DUF2127 domain-containing protein [Microbacterium sp.]|uniref:DUF2127 domain-containing protein n=1 Tax=Microbacterium sp. TaxID=51671 RepID=UPI002B479755|nr:DUF2127 domain-containing protein [Microbacterium sp.]HKT56822.1 DUF2127 domain-containing protein [Microbacterium sp.]
MPAAAGNPRREAVLDWTFLIGVLLKGVDGLVELVVGIPLLFVTPDQISGLARALTAGELAEDPNDFWANLLLRETAKFSHAGLALGGAFLLVHGVVKLAIVIALLLGSRRIYPWAAGALALLAILQIVDLVLKFSIGVLLLCVFDVIIIVLTVREWREGRSLHDVIRVRLSALTRRRARE